MRAQSILIVDDETTTTELLSIGLKKYGYHVEIANSGREGLSKIQEGSFDYALCDIEMPEMNGWEFASIVCSKYSEVKVILMTAGLREELQKEFEKISVLKKPFEFKSLIKLLKYY